MKKDNETYYERQARRADEALPYIFWMAVGLAVGAIVCKILGFNV